MKDHLLTLANGINEEGKRLNLVREYLQAHALRSLQLADGFSSIAFQGGTALRFIHGLEGFLRIWISPWSVLNGIMISNS